MIEIISPLRKSDIRKLKAGQEVFLTGVIYTARDQAHKRLICAKKLPLDLLGQVIYYCGPTNTPKGKVIGSCGPTTSSRMDGYTEHLLRKGLSAMIGKGRRSKEVRLAIKKHKAVYFLAYAGCGALVSKYVRKVMPVAYRDLGPEAIARLEVKDLPLIVAIDSKGKDIYEA
jgi:fumarate hydratase subunit beta